MDGERAALELMINMVCVQAGESIRRRNGNIKHYARCGGETDTAPLSTKPAGFSAW